MADAEEQQVSSSSPHYYDEDSNLIGTGAFSEAMAAKDVLLDDIVDLVGGAQDAIERHIAEDGGWTRPEEPERLESPPTPPPVPTGPVTEPIRVTELEEALTPSPEPLTTLAPPQAAEEELEPEPVPPVAPTHAWGEEVEEEALPDSTTAAAELEPPVLLDVAPKAEPESYTPEPEPEPIQQHVDVVSSPVVVEPPREEEEEAPPPPPTAPPAAAAAAEPLPQEEPAPVVTRAASEPVPAPAAYAHSPSKAQTHPLMQFPTVVDLLYWRDVKTTGVVFGAALLLLLSLTACSIVSVTSYIGLALLSVTVTFRIYKGVLQAIQKSDDGHPFKQYLDMDISLSDDLVHKYGLAGLDKFNKLVLELRRLFLVEDLVDSIKFAVLMWILTYIGALFNGLTLIILVLVGGFSLPVVYEKNQVQVDHYLALVNNQVKDIVGKVQDKVPGLKRKAE